MSSIEDEIRFGPDGQRIRDEARRALEAADCVDVLPTPVDQVMAAANLEEIQENVLDEGFLKGLRRRATGALKRALSKVQGVVDMASRLVYIADVEFATRKTFLRLHEVAHGWLPWQRTMYGHVEDCDQTIAPEIAEHFEAEANLFASELLFQGDSFVEQARSEAFGLRVPLRLSKKFGASAYAAIRRYVNTNDRCCVVVVLNPPELCGGHGFRAEVRRQVPSQSFYEQFRELPLPKLITPDHVLGGLVPIGKRMSGARPIELVDANGDRHECLAEAFDSTRQVFILIHVKRALGRRSIILAA